MADVILAGEEGSEVVLGSLWALRLGLEVYGEETFEAGWGE